MLLKYFAGQFLPALLFFFSTLKKSTIFKLLLVKNIIKSLHILFFNLSNFDVQKNIFEFENTFENN